MGDRHSHVHGLFGHQLSDPEVQQLWLAFFGHQNIGRFDVAMNDQVLVGVVHCMADFLEQSQSFVDAKIALVAITVKGHPIDVLHDQIGHALLGAATVQ